MSDHNHKSLRKPSTISTLDELKAAKKKASINATQNKLRISKSLDDIKKGGPQVILKNVVAPVVATGLVVYGISKLVSNSKDKKLYRNYYHEPTTDGYYNDFHAPPYYRPVAKNSAGSTTKKVIAALPMVIKFTKMGVNYMESNGQPVPSILRKLFVTKKD